MITDQLIKKVREFVSSDIERHGAPSMFQVDFTNEKGQWLAKKLKANTKVVLLGTLLMDCKLGEAYSKGKLKEHVELSRKKAEELLSEDGKITREESENVLHCVLEHHGVKKFYSVESEICCNADCYKFASIKGVVGGIKNLRDMPLEDIAKLFNAKADEKWEALSLEICKKELKQQYTSIKRFFKQFRS